VPSQSLMRAFVFLWWTLGLVLLVVSIQTVQDTLGTNHHSPLVLLAGTEAVAALLFLLPRTMRVGAAGLLLVLAVAFLLHLTQRQFRWDLVLYASAVVFVAIHGSLSTPQWRVAASARVGRAAPEG